MPANGSMHEEVSSALTLAPVPDALAIQRAPELVLTEATKAAQALAQVIESKPNKCVINSKTYLQFEDWQTLGRFYGVTAKASSTKYVEFGEGYEMVRGFEATADALLVSNNQVISSAEAMCLDDETKWSEKPLFQLKSMAQTRACAKVLRNVLAWVVVLAGYSGTPAEEMEADSIPAARAKSESRSHKKPVASVATSGSTIGFLEQKELFDLGHQHGLTPQQVMQIIAKHGFEQPGEISASALSKIKAAIKSAS